MPPPLGGPHSATAAVAGLGSIGQHAGTVDVERRMDRQDATATGDPTVIGGATFRQIAYDIGPVDVDLGLFAEEPAAESTAGVGGGIATIALVIAHRHVVERDLASLRERSCPAQGIGALAVRGPA